MDLDFADEFIVGTNVCWRSDVKPPQPQEEAAVASRGRQGTDPVL